jgi:folate-binding Fe-S cluster repair protein YgfZ
VQADCYPGYPLSIELTPDEIYTITGKVQPAAQMRELKRMGIRCHRSDNPDRPVIVLHCWLNSQKSSVESTPRLKSERQAA